MAATKKALAAKVAREGQVKKVEAEPQYATKEEFNSLNNSVMSLVEAIKSGALNQAPPSAAEIVEKKAIEAASPNKYTSNPVWEEMARDIIGEAVDHTEVEYLKGGGLMFTVCIKREFSNAPQAYLDMYKVDRRGKEVGSEGESGVKVWCEQIRNNLKRPKTQSS